VAVSGALANSKKPSSRAGNQRSRARGLKMGAAISALEAATQGMG
jgi:hypothetical protein